MKKRVLSLLLAVVMVLSLVPTVTFAAEEQSSAKVVVSVEGQTLSHGFYIEPTIVTFDEFITYWADHGQTVAPEEITAGGMIDYLIYQNGYTRDGRAEPAVNGAGYLGGVDGIRAGKGDGVVPDCLADDGITIEQEAGNDLYQFMYSGGGGWMFTVDNWLSDQSMAAHRLLNYGEHYVVDGQVYYVVRLQYTLAGLGADLGFTEWGTDFGYTAADKGMLYVLYANLAETGFLNENPEAREAALAVMTALDATQDEVDEAYAALAAAGQAKAPEFTENLAKAPVHYPEAGGEAAALTVAVSAPGKISYQWYRSGDRYNWETIDGAVEASYIPDVSVNSTVYYKCVVTAREEKKLPITVDSAIGTVVVGTLPQEPWWDWNGGDLSAEVQYPQYAASPLPLQVKATPAYGSGCTLSYQWYVGEVGVASIDEMIPIADATENTYVPDVSTECVKVYACRIYSNKDGNRNFIDSTLCTVTVSNEMILIHDESELREFLSRDLGGSYKLANDIALTSPWTPIAGFYGTLDGDGHVISGMEIEDKGFGYASAFFSYTMSSATIQNLGLTGSVKSNPNNASVGAGGLVGSAFGATTIRNCYLDVDVSGLGGYAAAGGVVQDSTNCLIENCYSTGTITTISATYLPGGIAGKGEGGTVKNCYTTSGLAFGTVGGVTVENVYSAAGDEASTAIPADMDEFLTALNQNGEFFAEDTENVNGGYPVLFWQTPVNYSELEKAIAEAEALNQVDYTFSSWTKFYPVLEKARDMLTSGLTTQADVDAAVVELRQAIHDLEMPDLVKETLIKAILGTISQKYQGASEDWSAMDMAAYGDAEAIDVETLKQNAEAVLNGEYSSATDYERVAISLTAAGVDASAFLLSDGSTVNILEKITGLEGLGTINGYLYGLLALDCGSYAVPENARWTRETILAYILEKQNDDGGWSLWGSKSDPDITAMTISALAPYMEQEQVAGAVDSALNCLSGMQTTNGGFAAWGMENSNSSAMVMVALAALDIDANHDSRFVKDGKSVLDSLLSFRTEDNTFGYTNRTENRMSTEQGFRALIAYTKQQAVGAYNIYDFTTEAPVQPEDPELRHAYETTGKYLQDHVTVPSVGTVGGDWTVLGLARSGREISDDYRNDYYQAVCQFIDENMDAQGRLHRAKSTENARVALTLAALGFDPRNVGGANLLTALGDLNYLKKQGINGPIWALITFDSKNYEIPGSLTRETLLSTILDAQLDDGGWALSAYTKKSDPDVTAMALTALAPYVDREDVAAAVETALTCLSGLQADDGTFDSKDQGGTAESCAQVITALSALGIDADQDARFVKNGNSVADGLRSFYVEDGGFRHIASGELDLMATEQGYYALAAYFRSREEKNRLFDMTDAVPAFVDVYKGDYYYDAVRYLAGNGIVNGTGNNRFQPLRKISRGEFVTMLYRLAGCPEVTPNGTYKDVPADSYYAKAIAWADENGITNGCGYGLFRPDRAMSREEMVTFLYRCEALKNQDAAGTALNDFLDQDTISDYARPAMAWAVETGLIQGYPNGYLYPLATAQRCQAAAVLYRYIPAE